MRRCLALWMLTGWILLRCLPSDTGRGIKYVSSCFIDSRAQLTVLRQVLRRAVGSVLAIYASPQCSVDVCEHRVRGLLVTALVLY